MTEEMADGIAVVALAVRTAGAVTPQQFWELLRDGREAVSTFSDEQMRGSGLDDSALRDPALVRTRPVLAQIEQFEPSAFGLTPREAAMTDPQLRLLLECAGETLEAAAIDPARFDGAVSVFVGTGPDSYYTHHLLERERRDPSARIDHLIGNSKDFVASRIAWSLGLRGPAINVQAGCATSLVAIHLAAQSLLAGESDLALAGGATVYVPQYAGYRYREGGINSPDGRCRAFSATADGTTPGDGVAVVALRRLSDALADGDPILGVLESTAVNNDGAGKAGFAAPNSQAQADVLAEALSVAGIEAGDLDYIEAHGTGTALGDEIEITALTEGVEGLIQDVAHRIRIGTHKPNIGDTWAAAGALGLAKVLLSLRDEQLPPSINCETLNPRIDFESSPFTVNTGLWPWAARPGDHVRRAGVHVFGLGGTNAHAIVAESPVRAGAVLPARPAELLTLSARSVDQLRQLCTELADHLAAHPDTNLRSVAWTVQSGRRRYPVRAAYLVRDLADAVRALREDSSLLDTVEAGASTVPANLDTLAAADYLAVLAGVAQVWSSGDTEIDPAVLGGSDVPVRLELPGHPYRRQRCWVEPNPTAVQAVPVEVVEARVPTAERVAEIWATEFGFDTVGADDDFFALGGHSLLAARIVDRLRQSFAAPLAVRDLLVEAPTPAGLAAILASGGSAAPAQTLPAHRPGESVPLGSAQRRMWMFMQLYPNSAAYNVGFPMRVHGPVDIDALRHALERLVVRHAALRTRFVLRAGEPVAVVDEPTTVPDLLTVRAQRDDAGAFGWITAQDGAPFDLAGGPLLRLAFAPAGSAAGPHLMLLCAHHTVVDGASLATLHAELAELYDAETRGRPASLSESVVQFPDLMLRAATPERTAARAAALEHWRVTLPTEPEALGLPFDHPRPEVPSFAGAAREFAVTATASAQLRLWARARHASTFAVVTAAFMTVLHRLTGQSDLAVGTVTHGRVERIEHEVVGCFADTVLLREIVHPDTEFATLVDRIRDSVADALTHQAAGFDDIARELGWDTASGRLPIPQAMVIGQQPVPRLRMGTATLEPIVDRVDTARFDLVVNFWEEDDEIRGAVTGALDVFAERTIARIAELVATALDSAAGAADATIAEITVVPPAQQQLLREEWTGASHPDSAQVSITGMPQQRPPTLHELVVRAARGAPSTVAITSGADQLTYGELLVASERMAQRLLDAGVRPEQIVAVVLPRGIDYVVALLGILRAGAAFVPIDPGWPQSRRTEVLTQAGAALTVSAGSLLTELPSATIAVDMHDVAEPGPHPLPEVDPEQLAYVMFTSGSTGVPKGVMIRHGAIGYRLRWQRELLEFGPQDGVLFKAPLGFDISINEIFLPLAVGARLAIAAPDHEADIGHLLEVIERDRVTFFYVVASMLDLLLDRPDAAVRGRSLRYVWCGGEALTDDLYRRFASCFPDAVMMHGYGPAEATIGVSCRRYLPAQAQVAVTIGRPNPGARVYVLDRRMRPAPVGAVGELYIGGLPLGRGYVNASGRTSESFVADPVSGLAGSRLYRTGDLATFTADGDLVFCGRADHQVKVHGYRVELSELEAVTARHPDVRRAAYVVDEEGELAAFCQPAAEHALTAEALRQWLRKTVPAHMVPRSIAVVDAIPMTNAGKIDRKALVARVVVAPTGADVVHVQASGATETVLAGIWQEVLAAPTVGVDRNFFELGGHSMSLIRVQNLIARDLGVEIALLELFEFTTIRDLAAHLDRGSRAAAGGAEEVPAGSAAVESARRRADAAREARQRAATRRRGNR